MGVRGGLHKMRKEVGHEPHPVRLPDAVSGCSMSAGSDDEGSVDYITGSQYQTATRNLI